MHLPIRIRALVATGMSLWLAALACLMGCTLPSYARSGASNASSAHANSAPENSSQEKSARQNSTEQHSAEQNQPDLMADMPNCPHHSGSSAPAKPHDGKPVRGGMSCCPVEVTVASKPDTVTLHVAPASKFVLASDFTPVTIRVFHAADFVSPVLHSGRDTLLETQLLRI
jgi:hypothetical protein